MNNPACPKKESIEAIAIRNWLLTLLGYTRVQICYIRDAQEAHTENEARKYAGTTAGALYVASRIASQAIAEDLRRLASQLETIAKNNEYLSEGVLHELDQAVLSIRHEIDHT